MAVAVSHRWQLPCLCVGSSAVGEEARSVSIGVSRKPAHGPREEGGVNAGERGAGILGW